jgi:hypothetical protein
MYLEEIHQTKFIRLNVQGKNEIKIINLFFSFEHLFYGSWEVI